ncbi:pilus assembly protein PilZ [Sphingopyxis lindanitolerans]|uniref:Pilus assembly protein PilZ n=1 Tax=Sphingopyxis lindanitolerans TaxID=2054227 RepID=A0A2S8B6M8_9SPHN|nr:PilZ domain-containing protein [Sphingopyxis lindanitolerans]PQM27976.1 pilus assembly protein PilZ [Sphingopyxis lindanitolerans]
MTNFRSPTARGHKRTPISIEIMVNGVLNFVGGRICDLSEGGARIDGASMPARSRCEIHYAGEVTYAVVMWSEYDRMGVRFPYELTHGALYKALEAARRSVATDPPPVFLTSRAPVFGRRGLN